MQQLEALAREAVALGSGTLTLSEAEVARQMQVCNACRYCEGFCAVFPAMARRLDFGKPDIHYLANLCHNCGACLHACQYAPPHEFAVNVPRAMAQVRLQTYSEFAWPRAFGALYRRNGVVLALAVALAVALCLVLVVALRGALVHAPLGGNFYAVLPHGLMAALFGAAFVYAISALAIGARRFWGQWVPGPRSADATAEAARDVLTLKYLDGGHGKGCNEEGDAFTLARRRFHHFTFYGFLLCFAATCVGTLYDYGFGLVAPYPFFSLPVLLGTAGGIGLLVGPAGLYALNRRRSTLHGDPAQRPMDRAFIALLFFTSVTGLALLAWRGTSGMATLLALHLGFVLALFVTMPYGKFAHAVYRGAALLKYAIERRHATSLGFEPGAGEQRPQRAARRGPVIQAQPAVSKRVPN
jgi:citrate/tricarballylate utilization protein